MENQSTRFILSEINIAVHIRKVFGQNAERFIYFYEGQGVNVFPLKLQDSIFCVSILPPYVVSQGTAMKARSLTPSVSIFLILGWL